MTNIQIPVIKQKIFQLLKEDQQNGVPVLMKKLYSATKDTFVEESLRLASLLISVEDSVFVLRQAIQLSPRSFELYRQLISEYLLCQDEEQATHWWNIATKIAPMEGSLWVQGVQIALQKGELFRAEVLLERVVLFLGDMHESVRRIRAQIHFWQGEKALTEGTPDKALFWIRRASLDDPKWSEPRIRLAELLQQMGRHQSAARYHPSLGCVVASVEQHLTPSQQSLAPCRD